MTIEEMQTDILMKEYASMREEVLLHFKNAKLHLKHFQGFIWYVFFASESGRLQEVIITAIGITRADLVLFIVFALNMVSYYFAFDILDSYFCIFLAAARLANIEEQINKMWRRNLLVWESMFQKDKVAIFGASRVAITVYQLMLVGIISLVLPFLCYLRLITSDNLSRPSLGWIAIGLGVAAFLWFLYAVYDVFVFRRTESRSVIDKMVGRVENIC
jgi:hypothetical protein